MLFDIDIQEWNAGVCICDSLRKSEGRRPVTAVECGKTVLLSVSQMDWTTEILLSHASSKFPSLYLGRNQLLVSA